MLYCSGGSRVGLLGKNSLCNKCGLKYARNKLETTEFFISKIPFQENYFITEQQTDEIFFTNPYFTYDDDEIIQPIN